MNTLGLDPQLVRKVKSYRWIIITSLWLIYFFVYFDRMAPAVVAPELTKEFEVSGAALGVLAASYFYPYALMQVPSGMLADYMGTRKAVAIFFTIAAIGTIIFGFAGSLGTAIFGRVLMGFGVAVVYVPIVKIYSTWWKPRDLAVMNGFLLMIGNIGALCAAAPLAALVAATNWRMSFYILGVASIVLAVVAYIIVRNKPTDMGLPSIEEIEGLEPIPPTKYSIGQAVITTLKSRNYMLGCVFLGLFYGPFMAFQGLWAIPYMMDVTSFTRMEASTVLTFWGVGLIIGCPLGGILSDKILNSRKKVGIYGGLLHTLGWVVLAISPAGWSTTTLSIWCLAMGITGGAYLMFHPLVIESVPRVIAGTALGMLNIFCFIWGSILQPWVGHILDGFGKDAAGHYPAAGYSIAFWIFAAGMAVAIISMVFARESLPVKAK